MHEFAEQLRIHKICLLVVSTSVRSLWYSFPEVKLLWYPPFSELREDPVFDSSVEEEE